MKNLLKILIALIGPWQSGGYLVTEDKPIGPPPQESGTGTM